MSVRAMAWALDSRRTGPLFAQARLVLVALADYADPEGRGAFPAKRTLADRLDLSERAVQRHVATLLADGLIEEGDAQLVTHYRADRRPIVYDLCMGAPAERGDTSVTPSRGDSDEDGVTDPTERGDMQALPRGDTPVTQTKNRTNNENPTPLVPSPARAALTDDPAVILPIERAQAERLWRWCNTCHRQALVEHTCQPDPMPENFRDLIDAAREDTP